MNGRNTLLDILKEAKAKAVNVQQHAKEAEGAAALYRERLFSAEALVRRLDTDAMSARRRVSELEAEIAAVPDAPDGPMGVPIQPVAAPEHVALIEDAKVGPWFTAMVLNGVWSFLQVMTLWADVERLSVSVAENHKGCGKVVAFPMRWIACTPDMLVELYECQKLLLQTADLTGVPEMFEAFIHRGREAQKIIHIANPDRSEHSKGPEGGAG